MKIIFYFAVTKYRQYIYLSETTPSDEIQLTDMIGDDFALETELEWDKLDDEHKPNDVGMYQAVVRYRQVAEDDYRLDVVSCTPMCVA